MIPFPAFLQPLAILFGAGFTLAVALALGGLLLGEACRDWPVRFVCGAAILSILVFLLCAAGLAYSWAFLASGVAAGVLRWRRGIHLPRPQLPSQYRILAFFFILYFILYFFSSMAPESSPDGVTYHLGLVARYYGEHGFHRITWNMYAALSEGMEMLFLFAFAFGRHSAASMVHFLFTVALAWQMFLYGRRQGFPAIAACAALLVFASPAVGIDGTSAYNDVAVATVAFTLFCLLQRLDQKSGVRLLIATGLAAGFCYAVKYTAWPAIVYGLALIWWKTRRPKAFAVGALAAAAGILPWLARNWIWYQNPVAPFYNKYFPNPYITESFENSYRANLAHYDLSHWSQLPLAATTTGSLGVLLGPVFLLSPLALLALRRQPGRQLLLAAAVFGSTYFTNISPRFLIPALPFVSLAMALVLASVPQLLLVVIAIHGILSWPPYIPRYCAPNAWYLPKVPYREALRWKNVDEYLNSHMFYYGVDRIIERYTPPGATVFTYRPIPEAYTSRRILVNYQSAENQIDGLIVQEAYDPQLMPTGRLRFSFPRQSLTALRLTQIHTSNDLWNIHELRLFDGARELVRDPGWKLTAHPDPWTIGDAFDGNPVTLWRSGATARPGQFVRVDFRTAQAVDAVLIETAPDQPGIRLKLEWRTESGQWVELSAAPRIFDAAPPADLRLAAMHELRRRGVDYILSFVDEAETRELRAHPDLWGIRQVAQDKETRLYRLP